MAFIKHPIPNKLVLGPRVYEKMQNCGFYPSPPVSYADMLLINNNLKAKVVGSSGGSVLQYLEQNEAEKKWDAMMRQQARYVNFIADGDEVKLTDSGFPLTGAERQRWKVPHAQRAPRVSYNNEHGGIDIVVDGQPFAKAYNYFLVTNLSTIKFENGRLKIAPGNSEIICICATQKKINVKNLTKGQQYYVLVCPAGTAGMGYYRDPVAIIYPYDAKVG